MGLYAFPCARASKLNQQICISPAPGCSSKLTHTGVEIDTCAFQTGCQLSSAATGMSLELRFLALFQWREAYVLDNWQLAELPQSGGREFDPRRSTIIYRFLCGFICVSLCQSIKIKPTNMYVCMYVCMYISMVWYGMVWMDGWMDGWMCVCVYVCNMYIASARCESQLTVGPSGPNAR